MNEELKIIKESEEFNKKTKEVSGENILEMKVIDIEKDIEGLGEIEKGLVEIAQKVYGTIYLCVNTTLEKSFTPFSKGKIVFWFNTEDKSTHMITEGSSVEDVARRKEEQKEEKNKKPYFYNKAFYFFKSFFLFFNRWN